MKCKKCEKEIGENQKFCKYCGEPVNYQKTVNDFKANTVCKKCGAPIKPGAAFCTKCGTTLKVTNLGEKRKKKKPIIIILIVIVIALIGVATTYFLYQRKASVEEKIRIENQIKEKEKKEKLEKTITEKDIKKNPDKKLNSTENSISLAETKKDNDYVIENSDKEYLTNSDISGLSLKELNYAKNEIYARHGRMFESPELQNYFDSKSWYEGKYSPDEFDGSYSSKVLNDCEKKNAELIRNTEYAIDPNGYQLDK